MRRVEENKEAKAKNATIEKKNNKFDENEKQKGNDQEDDYEK